MDNLELLKSILMLVLSVLVLVLSVVALRLMFLIRKQDKILKKPDGTFTIRVTKEGLKSDMVLNTDLEILEEKRCVVLTYYFVDDLEERS